MSFTIKCNNCGLERHLTTDRVHVPSPGKEISIDVMTNNTRVWVNVICERCGHTFDGNKAIDEGNKEIQKPKCICTGLNEYPYVPNPDCPLHGGGFKPFE